MATSGDNFVVILVDESSAMSSVMRDKLADGTESLQSNAQRVATSVNNLLRQIADGPHCDVAVVGYRSDAEGKADVGIRWPASLFGSEFVSSAQLHAAARVEHRTRKLPQADGTVLEDSVPFFVWYEPSLGAKAPQIAAFAFCKDLVHRRTTDRGGRGILVHVFSGASSDGSPQRAIDELLRSADAPLVVQCHMAASSALVTTAFPSKQAFVASGMARDLFARASELPASLRDFIKSFKVPVHLGARAAVHNAKMGDLFRCLQLAKQHVAGNSTAQPLAAEPRALPVDTDTPTTDVPAVAHSNVPVLLVLILDRSVEDPYSGIMPNACSRLSEAGNEFLKLLSSKNLKDLPIDVSIVSYGLGQDGHPDVRATFEGPLAGQVVVRNSDLIEGAIRIEESESQVSNGAGGLITVKKKSPIYFDVEPAACSPPQAAFAAAAGIIGEWLSSHPSGPQPLILHLTRGAHAVSDIQDAVAEFASSLTGNAQPILQQLVVTEAPHKSLAYPDNDSDIQGDSLRAWWQVSGILPNWESLQGARRPYISADSKAFVVNGKFDVLGEELANALGAAPHPA